MSDADLVAEADTVYGRWIELRAEIKLRRSTQKWAYAHTGRNALIVAAFLAGESRKSLAARYGLTATRIGMILRTAGLAAIDAKRAEEAKARSKNTTERTDRVMTLRDNGLTWKAIAAEIGVSKARAAQIYNIGWRRRRRIEMRLAREMRCTTSEDEPKTSEPDATAAARTKSTTDGRDESSTRASPSRDDEQT